MNEYKSKYFQIYMLPWNKATMSQIALQIEVFRYEYKNILLFYSIFNI